jgi:hypothetical protein
MVLGLIQPLKKMSTRDISWGDKCGCQCVGLTTLSPSCDDCLETLEASTYWSHKGLSRPVMGQFSVLLYTTIFSVTIFIHSQCCMFRLVQDFWSRTNNFIFHIIYYTHFISVHNLQCF